MTTQAALERRPRARSRRPWPETWVAAAFVAPAALVVLLIVIIPLARAAWMSLFDIVLTHPGDEPFVGLGNYIDQLTNWSSRSASDLRSLWTSRSAAAGSSAR
jgi:ABC-type sugar transport system permease subunit